MNLFLLRHGLAADLGDSGLPDDLKDADRPLTAPGEQKLRRAARAMRALELRFDVVITSPLLRARQTAELIATELKLRKPPVFSDHLAPVGSPKALIEQLAALGARKKNILLVGHEPYLSRFIALLCAGNTSAAIELKKGGLAKLELKELRYARCATLAWLLTPKQLGLMA